MVRGAMLVTVTQCQECSHVKSLHGRKGTQNLGLSQRVYDLMFGLVTAPVTKQLVISDHFTPCGTNKRQWIATGTWTFIFKKS